MKNLKSRNKYYHTIENKFIFKMSLKVLKSDLLVRSYDSFSNIIKEYSFMKEQNPS